MAHATRSRTVDAERARIREAIEKIEVELLRWNGARLALGPNADPAWAKECRRRCEVLRGKWERRRKRLDELRSALTLPW